MPGHEHSIKQVESIFGHTFKDKLLCARAIQMAAPKYTFILGHADYDVENNDRLSIVGKVALQSVFAVSWFNTTDDDGNTLDSGDWDDILNGVLSKKRLCARGVALGLRKLIIKSPGMDRATDKMVFATMTAIFGAIKIDAGEEAVQRAVKKLCLTGGGLDRPVTANIKYAGF